MSLFEELQRRRVFRLRASYVVVAWVIIQVVTAIEEPLRLPDWFDTTIIVLLGVGFPIAVIMSWIDDVTPEGIVRDGDPEQLPASIDYGKIALGSVVLLAAFMIGNYLNSTSGVAEVSDSKVQIFEIGIATNANRIESDLRPIAIAPDGRSILYVAEIDDRRQLFSRPMNSLESRAIAGTDAVDLHFTLSPGGDNVAFSSRDNIRLRRVSVNGGIATPLHESDQQVDHITWGDSGTIVFTERAGRSLLMIPAGGGQAVEFATPDGDDVYKHPSFVPGTDWVAFAMGARGMSQSYTEPIGFVSLDGDVKMTGLHGSSPRVTRDGRLLYYFRNTIWSAQLDTENLRVIGDPLPVVEDVYYWRFGHFDVSEEGSLVFVRDSALGKMTLV